MNQLKVFESAETLLGDDFDTVDRLTCSASGNRFLIGDVLLKLGFLSKEQLEKALRVARLSNLPIGKILVAQERITQCDMTSAVTLQYMLREGSISICQAIRVFDISKRNKWKIKDALLTAGFETTSVNSTRLGELLTASGHIDRTQLYKALLVGAKCGLPLGVVLVNTTVIDENLLAGALKAQLEVRQGRLSSSRAIEQLSARVLPGGEEGIPVGTYSIGELLRIAGVISEIEKGVVSDIALSSGRRWADVLVDMNWSSRDQIVRAKTIADRLKNKSCSISLTREYITPRSGDVERRKQAAGSLSLLDFMRLTGYLNRSCIRAIVEVILHNRERYQMFMTTPVEGPDTYSQRHVRSQLQRSEFLLNVLSTIQGYEELPMAEICQIYECSRDGLISLEKAVIEASTLQ